MKNDEKSKETLKWHQEFRSPIILSGIAIAIFFITFAVANFSKEKTLTYFGEVGDVFAGVSASLAFIWLVYVNIQTGRSIKMHQEELKLTRDEMEAQRKIMRAQKEEFEKSVRIAGENSNNVRKQIFWESYENICGNITAIITSLDFVEHINRGNRVDKKTVIYFSDETVRYEGQLGSGVHIEGHGNKDKLFYKCTNTLRGEKFLKKYLDSGEKIQASLISKLKTIVKLFYNLKAQAVFLKEEIVIPYPDEKHIEDLTDKFREEYLDFGFNHRINRETADFTYDNYLENTALGGFVKEVISFLDQVAPKDKEKSKD